MTTTSIENTAVADTADEGKDKYDYRATRRETEAKIKAIEPELEAKIEAKLKARAEVVSKEMIAVGIEARNGELEVLVKDWYAEEKRRIGFCHAYWEAKKKILKEDYGIDWMTPAELNPDNCYD